ncbi:MAG: hypothetical protein ACJ78Q_09725 [Chloroflexia bacterium]
MLVITLPFSIEALRWAAGRYLPGRLSDLANVSGEPTLPVPAPDPALQPETLHDRQSRVRVFGSDWLVMEALPAGMLLPRAGWTACSYFAALTALADLHATWWDHPPDPADCSWTWAHLGPEAHHMAEQARAALLQIEAAPWGSHFFTREQTRAWLIALDDPSPLLAMLQQMPQTLIAAGSMQSVVGSRQIQLTADCLLPTTYSSGHAPCPTAADWQMVGVGPAPYDLACFYSSARWWFGRLPLSLTTMRNHYLDHLNHRLGRQLDHYLFDAAFDAARAWQFLTSWPTAILERHPILLAHRHHLQTTVIGPAYASLRRCSA